MTTTTGPGALEAVHQLLDDLFEAEPVAADPRHRFETVVAELAANIVEHTPRGADPVHLQLVVESLPDRLDATFEDDGPEVRIDLAAVTMPDPLAERGRGLAIAKQLSETLNYRRVGAVNRWFVSCRR
ncbi:ATP-binding protein [Rhodococcus sp. SGAir0479]|uniref:ATP-binding protein n=1 Tax=Rhodococcus sp. SGAir0479 TaxID=2567884 RepID=UPI0020C7B693|nr:ATP-binding protein [Rhodococcus sp. SGAir0479]